MEHQNAVKEAMSKVGNAHAYQRFVFIFFGFVWFGGATILFGPAFLLMNPIFKCAFSDQQVDESDACPQINLCEIDNDYTIVAYMSLYCERQLERSLIQSALPIGSVLGLLGMNSLCDIKGRRFSVLICLISGVIGMIFTMIGAFVDSISLIFVSQVVAGFGGYSIMIISYVVFFDICEDKLRQSGTLIMNIIWSMSQAMYFFFNNWFNLWYYYMICSYMIPTIIVIIVGWKFFIESPNFLLIVKKDVRECLNSLQKIGHFNGMPEQDIEHAKRIILESVENESGRKDEVKEGGFKQVLKKIFTNWVYLKPIIILSLVFAGGCILYYGVGFSLDDVGFGYSINILLMGIMETASVVLLRVFLSRVEKARRKLGLIIFYFTAGGLGLLFLIPPLKSNLWGSIVIICIIRFISNFGYIFFTFLQTESFPSDIQSTGAGVIQALSQLGSFIAPYLVTILIDAKIYPILIFGIILIAFILPTYFLKETLGAVHDNNVGIKEEDNKSILSDSDQQ